MKERDLHARLAGAGIAGVGSLEELAHDPYVMVEADALVEVLTFLRDDPDCAMEMLHNVTAVERADRIELVYHLCSLAAHHSLTIKVTCARPEGGGHDSWHPQVPSVAGVYRSADWHEREQWDLLGVRFAGHPDPRRILLPEEWIGHPLRKDYVYPTEHDGVPLELDAVPMYEQGGDASPADRGPREAGTPLPQGATPASRRPDAGGRAPAPDTKGKD